MDYSDCMFSCFLLSNFSACLEVSLTSGTSWNTPRHQATAITTPRLEAKVAIAGSCKRWSNAFRRFAQLEGWNMCFIRLILGWWSKPWMENIELTWRTCSSFVCIYGCFLKWWYPTTMGFSYWKWSFGVFWGYHHLRKHPYKYVTICVYIYVVLSDIQWHLLHGWNTLAVTGTFIMPKWGKQVPRRCVGCGWLPTLVAELG